MIKFNLASYILCCNLLLACSNNSPQSAPQQPANEKKVLASELSDSIRSVDFKRISYPRHKAPNGNQITTEPGEYSPAFVEYGDVTADSKEDAIVVLPIQTKGTAIPHHVYIFTVYEGKPMVLADFETCDRADGGLRRALAQDGMLTLELYGKGKTLGSNLCADDGTRKDQPYPYAVTRSRYAWKDGAFIQQGDAEVFSDATYYGSPVMTPYE